MINKEKHLMGKGFGFSNPVTLVVLLNQIKFRLNSFTFKIYLGI